jgi:hypothetical protein
MHVRGFAVPPRTVSVGGRLPRPLFTQPDPHQILRSCVIVLPVPPLQCPQLMPDPAIEFFQYTLHFGEPEVRNPSPQLRVELLDHLFQTVGRVPLETSFGFSPPAARGSVARSSALVLVPRHAVAQKLSLPRTRHSTLVRIDLQFQSLLQKRRDRRHYPLPAPLALDVDVAVVGVAAEAMPAPFQFAVQIGQQDIRQQRRQRSALRRPSVRALTTPPSISPASR